MRIKNDFEVGIKNDFFSENSQKVITVNAMKINVKMYSSCNWSI